MESEAHDYYITAETVGQLGRPLTVEEARTVPLSWRPLKRLGQLAAYGGPFHLRKIGMSPLPQYVSRRDLIRTAQSYEEAVERMRIIDNQGTEGTIEDGKDF